MENNMVIYKMAMLNNQMVYIFPGYWAILPFAFVWCEPNSFLRQAWPHDQHVKVAHQSQEHCEEFWWDDNTIF